MSWQIDTGVPYGNACDTAIIEDQNYTEVSFRADPHGGLEALWFCFRLQYSQGQPNKPIRLVLKNPQNTLAGPSVERFRPVIHLGDDWQRLPAGIPEDLPDDRRQVVWVVNSPSQIIDIAFCYPYGMPQIDELVQETSGYWKQDTIGVTQHGRPIIRLSNNYGASSGNEAGLYLLARQHSGETPGSWVLDGFLRYLATLGDSVPLVWVIPFVNRDGVEEGDYGKDPYPIDLNRGWQRPFHQTMRYEIQCIERDIALWASRCKPTLGMDFHAPGGTENDGIYAYIPNSFYLKSGHLASKVWGDAIGEALDTQYRSPEFTRITTPQNHFTRWGIPEKADRFAEYMWNEHTVPAVSPEVPYALCVGDTLMTRERYREAGKQMATAVVNRIQSEG